MYCLLVTLDYLALRCLILNNTLLHVIKANTEIRLISQQTKLRPKKCEIDSEFKIIFRKMLRFEGFLGVANFLAGYFQWLALHVCERSEMNSYSQHLCFKLLSLHTL
jgi:hypothetical protein